MICGCLSLSSELTKKNRILQVNLRVKLFWPGCTNCSQFTSFGRKETNSFSRRNQRRLVYVFTDVAKKKKVCVYWYDHNWCSQMELFLQEWEGQIDGTFPTTFLLIVRNFFFLKQKNILFYFFAFWLSNLIFFFCKWLLLL